MLKNSTSLKFEKDVPLVDCPLQLPSLSIWEPPAFHTLARNFATNPSFDPSVQARDLAQLEKDLEVVRADASARETLLVGETEKLDTWLGVSSPFSADADTASGSAKDTKNAYRKSRAKHKKKGELADSADSKVSDRAVSRRKKKKAKKQQEGEQVEEVEPIVEEEFYEDHHTDHVAFWGMVDQQFSDPTATDLKKLSTVRDSAMPDVVTPLKQLGFHYSEQWSADAALKLQKEEETAANSGRHSTRALDKASSGEEFWATSRKPTLRAPSLADLILSALVEEKQTNALPKSFTPGPGSASTEGSPGAATAAQKFALKPGARTEPAALEQALQREMQKLQVLKPGWSREVDMVPRNLENDQMCEEIRRNTARLKAYVANNKKTIERLQSATQMQLGDQDKSELFGPKAAALQEKYIRRKRALKSRGHKKKKKRAAGGNRAMGTAAILAAAEVV
jgi:hypothetical protein